MAGITHTSDFLIVNGMQFPPPAPGMEIVSPERNAK